MIEDRLLMAAVAKIKSRAERQSSFDKIIETYVEVGVLPQLNSTNHQVFYGRRGTGKTHLLKVLESELKQANLNSVVYIDCRTLGSTTQFSDLEVPISRRCLALFRDILNGIYWGLLEYILDQSEDVLSNSQANKIMDKLEDLQNVISQPIQSVSIDRIKTHSETERRSGLTLAAQTNLDPRTAGFEGGFKNEKGLIEGQDAEYSINTEDKIVFPELFKILNEILNLGSINLYILIDEWADLPRDIQPYLAEFLKRGVLPIQLATVKISALEYRSSFNYRTNNKITGFEMGGDISATIDLDDYFVFDRNPGQIVKIYADVLLKHLESELPRDYLSNTHLIASSDHLISHLFTEKSTFEELARASEGVIRDLISIFTSSYFDAQRRGRKSIDKKAITESAKKWFEQDKVDSLGDRLYVVLQRIVTEVIGSRNARSFLLPQNLERHPIVQELFDARVLHHMQRGYADKDNPGVRYNIYSIDYGTYVDLLGTSKQPQLDLFADDEELEEDIVVPFDDKRSIRRIVLNPSILK